MYIIYVDESGDIGLQNSPTSHFVLACVLVHDSEWLLTLDRLVDLRRDLYTKYGISTREELKSTFLAGGRGVMRALKWDRERRMALLREIIQYEAQRLPVKTFAIAIDKNSATQRGWGVREAAWTFTFQRINRFCEPNEYAVIFPDEGDIGFPTKLLRKMRRFSYIPNYYGKGSRSYRVQRIVEDLNFRNSSDSYFLQLADWNAYVAQRSSYVSPTSETPDNLWDELEPVHIRQVNSLKGGPPAIVIYPR